MISTAFPIHDKQCSHCLCLNILIFSAFSMNIPELPIQVVAVTDAPATNFHMTQELNQVLVAEVRTATIIIHIMMTMILRAITWPTS